MKDAYTAIMDEVRAKCPACADKLAEQHRLLAIINDPKLAKVLDLAREMVRTYTRGMKDGNPYKGIGNRLADALDSLDGDSRE